MKCRYTTVGGGNEGHPCSWNAMKFGLCSVHLQVEYGHFYGGHRVKKSETCLNCGEPRSDAPVDFYCRAKPAAQQLIGGVGRRRSFVPTGPKEKEEPYQPATPERVNQSFRSKVRVIKAQDRRTTGVE
jgi:hypothetical protein